MPLSPSTSCRVLKHTCATQIEAFACNDGLPDIDASIINVEYDARLRASDGAAGQSMHDLWLHPNVVDVQASRLPSKGFRYSFRHNMKECLTGIGERTHLSESAQVFATAAIQVFADELLDTHDGERGGTQSEKPFQLDRCHVLRAHGAEATQYYPRWPMKPETVYKSS